MCTTTSWLDYSPLHNILSRVGLDKYDRKKKVSTQWCQENVYFLLSILYIDLGLKGKHGEAPSRKGSLVMFPERQTCSLLISMWLPLLPGPLWALAAVFIFLTGGGRRWSKGRKGFSPSWVIPPQRAFLEEARTDCCLAVREKQYALWGCQQFTVICETKQETSTYCVENDE